MRDFATEVDGVLRKIAALLTERNWKMATAESCTGGWVAKCCTDMVGSSDWFDRGYVSYSYAAKEQMLGVSAADMLEHGAVSEAIARQMATGAKQNANVEVAVAITGIAGPGGAMPGKPVGLVHFSWCIGDQAVTCEAVVFEGDREQVRQRTVVHALQGILSRLESLA
jgi:nicotinamide-nucleotide amidase